MLNVNGNPTSLKHAVRMKLKSEFPEAKVFDIETMAEEMSNEVSERVFLMQVAMAFGALALFLSILGLMGCLPTRFRCAKRKSVFAWRWALRASGS